MIVVSLALPLLPGCCGLFAGPSADQIRASIRRSIPNGASAQEAVNALKRRGFDAKEFYVGPEHDVQHVITGSKVTDQCLFTLVDRGVLVKVALDDHSRVVGVETEDTTNAP